MEKNGLQDLAVQSQLAVVVDVTQLPSFQFCTFAVTVLQGCAEAAPQKKLRPSPARIRSCLKQKLSEQSCRSCPISRCRSLARQKLLGCVAVHLSGENFGVLTSF